MAERPIVKLPRGKDGLFIEPKKLTPEIQRMVDHNRERFVKKFSYADEFTGDQATYDPQGDYNCGRCNQIEDKGECLLLTLKRVNAEAGSCRHWESIRAGDPELPLYREDAQAAAYGVATNGKGFGCARCPFSKQAENEDDHKRTHWCGEGGFHQTSTACCSLNGAEVQKAKPGKRDWYDGKEK